ncbi:MAG TPA: hypothetical protein VG125_02320, partial [Pirellulales bacterium]|nr:hypothetical protein [Pirellulales bacterium]
MSIPSSSPAAFRPNRPGGPDSLKARKLGITGRLEAIARGESIPTETHPAVHHEEPVLEIGDFCRWYGTKQALFD